MPPPPPCALPLRRGSRTCSGENPPITHPSPTRHDRRRSRLTVPIHALRLRFRRPLPPTLLRPPERLSLALPVRIVTLASQLRQKAIYFAYSSISSPVQY